MAYVQELSKIVNISLKNISNKRKKNTFVLSSELLIVKATFSGKTP